MDNFNYTEFIRDGIDAQQNYAEKSGIVGPKDELTPEARYEKVIVYLGHLIEEAHEARAFVPRRSWKTKEVSFLDDQETYDAFIAEMYDILLFHRAVLAYAGVDPDYFTKIVLEKDKYNKQRKDHRVNNTTEEVVIPHPLKELHGDCLSSDLKPICENPEDELTGNSLKEIHQ